MAKKPAKEIISNYEAKTILAAAADRYATLLKSRLSETYRELDLDSKELNSAHEYFSQPREITPEEFWEKTAVLRSALLSKTAKSVISEIEAEFQTELIEVFSKLSFDPEEQIGEAVFFVEDNISISNATNREIFTAAIQKVFDPVFRYSRLKHLGEQWHKLLAEQATQRATKEAGNIPDARFRALISLHETNLLTETPWVYTDRLLAAFELSHQEIKEHATKSKNALTQVFARLN